MASEVLLWVRSARPRGPGLQPTVTLPRLRAIGSMLLALSVVPGCGPGEREPIAPIMLAESLDAADAEWIEGWEQQRSPFEKTTSGAGETTRGARKRARRAKRTEHGFEQYRGTQLSLRIVLPADAMLRGQAQLLQSHDRRASHFPILGEVNVSLQRDTGERLAIIDFPFSIPGDAVGFALNHDLSELAGEEVSLVFRLDAGESEPTRRSIQRRLRLAWSDLRVEGTRPRRSL
jgi:hypothetical protein